MSEKIILTPQDEILKESSKTESETIENQYKNISVQRLKNMFSQLLNHMGFDIIESAISLIKSDEYAKTLSPEELEKELAKHSLYHIISCSSIVEGEKYWKDLSDEEKNNPSQKEFIKLDQKIEKFIEDEYNKIQNTKK